MDLTEQLVRVKDDVECIANQKYCVFEVPLANDKVIIFVFQAVRSEIRLAFYDTMYMYKVKACCMQVQSMIMMMYADYGSDNLVKPYSSLT